MTLYISTILLLFIFSIIDVNYTLAFNTRRWMSIIVYLLLVIQVGLRWETGTDWSTYLRHFESINNATPNSLLHTEVEYGYNLFVWLATLIFSDYSYFLLIHAIIYYYLIFKSFQRYSPYLYLSLMLFYTLSMGVMGSNRQLIALAICIYALRYVIEKKTIYFFLFIFLAASFHLSSFLFITYYFINFKIKPSMLISFLGISIIIYIIGNTQISTQAFSYLGHFMGDLVSAKTSFYLDNAKDTFSGGKPTIIGLIKRLILFSIFSYNRKTLSEKLPYYNIMFNGYTLGILIYFIFANSLLVMISRGSLFFNIMEPLLISSQILIFKRKENKVAIIFILLVFSFFFFFQSISPYPDLFLPYKGIFINSDFHRIM
ncbi:MAG: EpsG family protein [Bacteroidales bacterium]|nr:EpsG family protein [Bacteroidales bacterium]